MANEKTLSDALMLLTKVSDKISDRLTNLEKMVGNTPKKDKNIQETKKKELSESVIEKLLNFNLEKQTKKPEEGVEKKQEVIVTDFGRDAAKSLAEFLKPTLPSDKKEPEDKKEGMLSKLLKYLPVVLGVVGALGGMFSSIFSGKLKNIWEDLKEGRFEEAFKKAGTVLLQAGEPFLKSLPIIGPIYSFYESYKDFNEGRLIPGLKNLVQGIVGLLPLPRSLKVGLIGGIEALGYVLEQKYEKEPMLPTGAGSNFLPAALKTIGKLLPIGVLKKLPLIGSALNFYDAYEAFNSESSNGANISKGILSLSSGIASLIPGAGTLVSIGLDVLNAMMFETKETQVNGKTVKTINLRDWYKKTTEFLSQTFPMAHLIQMALGLEDLLDGKYTEGFKKLSASYPEFEAFKDFSKPFEVETRPKKEIGSVHKFIDSVVNNILAAIVNAMPGGLGIRYALGKFLGIENMVEGGTPLVKLEAKAEQQRLLNLTPEQREAEEKEKNRSKATMSMMAGNYTTWMSPPKDVMEENKITVPKDNNLAKPLLEFNNTLESFAKKQNSLTDENNTLTKNLGIKSLEMQEKSVQLLESMRTLLEKEKPNVSNNNVINLPQFNYSVGSGASLRGLQNASGY